ncbi:SAM-dependent methyltransferase [Pectobacterium carotovorum]|uniref:SAM-dependent methyltransferase n=1 Tax=Pectobacterium carotovorum TaxID=554 RepID=UPI00057CF1E9|nr:SAM-dependent methyltransferase [Pectobacterium carotovorum]KHT28559.1 hypothetical protein RC98_08665 [Pectobacterium carotovorum subsp. carotovorum]
MPVQAKLSPKSLGKYFTRDAISDLLVSYLSVKNPQVVLDLGSGDGSLSKAAAKRWNDAKFITVDIDSDTCISDHIHNYRITKHSHYKLDVLEPSLISDIGINPEGIDIALCNPPFIKPKWKEKHLAFLQTVGIKNNIFGVENITAEVLFVIQNLLSLRSGGQLGLIVPDGFISGEKNRKFRDFILQSNSIDRVIKLPKNSFVGTNIQAHIVIITKGIQNSHVSLTNLSSANELSDTIVIKKEQAIESLDYSYHYDADLINKNWLTLSEIGCNVSRGNFNSKQCKCSAFPIFHTVDFDGDTNHIDLSYNEKKSKRYYKNLVVARNGDILIARVGRNLANKICLVINGSSLISDCIYKLEVPIHWRKKVFDFLVSEKGRELLKSRSRGTGASYLTMSMLLQLPLVGIVKD